MGKAHSTNGRDGKCVQKRKGGDWEMQAKMGG
jgi:hypothetical protein